MKSQNITAAAWIVAVVVMIVGLFAVISREFTGQSTQIQMSVQQLTRQPDVTFRSEHVTNANVQIAVAKKEALLKDLTHSKGLSYPPADIFVRILIVERLAEIWAAAAAPELPLLLLKDFPLCEPPTSDSFNTKKGALKPIIPGTYSIDQLFPSDYVYNLSLTIRNPNTPTEAPISLHKGCDNKPGIQWISGFDEFYLLAMEAKSAGQNTIIVEVLPARLTDEATRTLRSNAGKDQARLQVLDQLKTRYDRFEQSHQLPALPTVDVPAP